MNELERAMKCAEDAVCLAARVIAAREAAIERAEKYQREYHETAECLSRVSRERDALRVQVRDLSDKLADAEAKIEAFNAALDTEARR